MGWGLDRDAGCNLESLELRMQVSEVATFQNVEGWVPDEGKWFSSHLLCNGKKLNILEEKNNTGRDQYLT